MHYLKLISFILGAISFGCLPRPELQLGDQAYRNGSKVTSIKMELPADKAAEVFGEPFGCQLFGEVRRFAPRRASRRNR